MLAVNETITFHDSCYLGRYNEVYDPPREILKAIPGVKLVEMERNRETGMCCGAGGGLMWMEEETGHRINVSRTEQALAVNPGIISSGCPYCLTMLSDGTKAKEVEETVKMRLPFQMNKKLRGSYDTPYGVFSNSNLKNSDIT